MKPQIGRGQTMKQGQDTGMLFSMCGAVTEEF